MGNNISRQRHRNIQASRSSWTHHEDSQQRGEATCDESSVPENGQYVTHADHEDEERPSRLRRLSRSLVSKRSSGHWAPARGPSLHRSEESARYRRQKRQSFFKRQSSPPKNSAAGDIKHPTSAGSHQTGTLACVSDDYSTTETESIARAGQQSSQTIGHNTPLPLGTSSSRYTPASELPSPPPNPLATPPNLEDLGFDDPRPLHNDAFFRRSASPQSPISQQSSEGIATSPSDDATLSPFATNRAVPARRVVVQGTIGTGGPSESSESTTAPPHPPASQAGTSNNDASHNVQAAEDFAPLPHTTGASAEPPTTDPSSPNTPRPNIYNPAARAVLVARLLSVASAATAASLLPGRIVVGGRTVDSFPGLDAEQTQPSPGVADESGSARPEPVRASASSGFIPPSPVPVSENMPSEPTTPQRPSIRSRSSSAPSTPSRTYPSFRSLFQRPSAQRPASSNTSDSTSPQHSPTSASETSDSVHRSGALMVSRPSLRNQPMPDAQAPEGSFERFLSDLQTEVSLAILRDHFIPRRSASANGEPEEREAFSFFRSYRFGDRVMDAAGNLHEAESEDSSTSPSTVSPAPSQSPETRETSSDQRSPSSSPSPTSPPGNRVAPLLLVGVRSVPSRQLQSESNPAETPPFDGVDPFHLMGQGIETHRQRSPLQESDRLYPFASPLSGVPSPGSQPSSTTNETVPLLEPDSQPRASTFNESPVVSRGEVDIAADSQDMEFDSLRDRPPSSLTSYHTADGGATSSPNSGHSSPQDQQAPPPRPQPNASRRPERDFIIWIAGGVYPASHPLLLLSDLDQADYNDLIRLAEFIGNVKRSTATESEVEQSGLKLLLPNELPALLEKGEVLSNTTERCLVCLEDYADAPEASVRLLECRHAFHKDCVDKWLLQSKNACPCCRTVAVKTRSDSSEGVSDPQDEREPLEQLASAMQSESLA